jgi:hypothetical protein
MEAGYYCCGEHLAFRLDASYRSCHHRFLLAIAIAGQQVRLTIIICVYLTIVPLG